MFKIPQDPTQKFTQQHPLGFPFLKPPSPELLHRFPGPVAATAHAPAAAAQVPPGRCAAGAVAAALGSGGAVGGGRPGRGAWGWGVGVRGR